MTHDELLTRVKEGQWVDRQEMMVRSNALRAVVELHKPYDNSEDIDGSDLRCSECGQGFEYYPCPTIQRIEKELR